LVNSITDAANSIKSLANSPDLKETLESLKGTVANLNQTIIVARRVLNDANGQIGGPKDLLRFVSLAEHYVEIIADHATHALVAGSAWNAIIDEFVAAIRANRVAEGALAALAACGGILEGHAEHSSDKIRS